jgi:K+-transporting ATPase ATPase C chain
MFDYLKPAAVLLLLFTVLTGVVYPALVTGIAQLVFSEQANGSLLKDAKGQLIGSELLGQSFTSPAYFWGRPSATSPNAYNAASSTGSNLGPTNPALMDVIKDRIQALKNADPTNNALVPVDLVTASGSGLDPHITVAAANYQLKRVAAHRHLKEKQLSALIKTHAEDRQWFIFGEPRVNVLKLNVALDDLSHNK